MGDNAWIVDNLNAALGTWNSKLAELWQLLTQSPKTFKGGGVWQVVMNIHNALKGIGLGLLVLFFAAGVVKTCGSLAETRRPERALALFVRFVLAKAAVQYGLDMMLALFEIAQGTVGKIMTASGAGGLTEAVLPQELIDKIGAVGFWQIIPLWAVTLLGGLFITVLSFVMILTVYGRMFRLYIFAAIAPLPMAAFAGQPTANIGRSFLQGRAHGRKNAVKIPTTPVLYMPEEPAGTHAQHASAQPVREKGYFEPQVNDRSHWNRESVIRDTSKQEHTPYSDQPPRTTNSSAMPRMPAQRLPKERVRQGLAAVRTKAAAQMIHKAENVVGDTSEMSAERREEINAGQTVLETGVWAGMAAKNIGRKARLRVQERERRDKGRQAEGHNTQMAARAKPMGVPEPKPMGVPQAEQSLPNHTPRTRPTPPTDLFESQSNTLPDLPKTCWQEQAVTNRPVYRATQKAHAQKTPQTALSQIPTRGTIPPLWKTSHSEHPTALQIAPGKPPRPAPRKAPALSMRCLPAQAAKAAHAGSVPPQKAAAAAARTHSRRAVRPTLRGVKTAVERLASTLKTSLAALQNLVSAIAAGSAAAVAIVVIVCMAALVAGSSFGIFFAGQPTVGGVTVQDAVQQLSEEYYEGIEAIKTNTPHDRIEYVPGELLAIRWQDVLSVFAADMAASENGQPVAVLQTAQVDRLKEILHEMYSVSHETYTESHEEERTTTNDAGQEVKETVTVTETVLKLTIRQATPQTTAAALSFTARQNEQLALLLEPQYTSLWAELLGGYTGSGGQIITPNGVPTGSDIFQWPLPEAYTVTSGFGQRVDPFTGETSCHGGTDIAAPKGTPILAAADGTVTLANATDPWGGSYGYYIKISHGAMYDTLYAHCSQICVTPGQIVRQGEVIGYVGSTGNSTGNHLHFEVWENGVRRNAMECFEDRICPVPSNAI